MQITYPDITQCSALDLSRAIHTQQVSCREVMQATLAQVDRLNPLSNAIVSRVEPDLLMSQAAERDAQLARGQSLGWMHGLPQAIKDLANVQGLRTSLGSPLMKDFVAAEDGLMAQRMKAAGAIVIGKTNTPEFGLGSHTFNEVFGATRNAWNPSKSAGGSSGGAAVALAQRMLCVADGSDFMGSLRNPAGWNHVFGLRPSQGLVPMWPAQDVFIAQLGTEGPMARHVRDLAMLLSVQAGKHAASPLSLSQDPAVFAGSLDSDPKGTRIGWLGDLQGYLPMESGILDICQSALGSLSDMGCQVDEAVLGMPPEQVWQAWLVWRQALVGPRVAPFLVNAANREKIKPEALWEHDQSLSLTGAQLMSASATRTRFFQSMLQLFERFDVLAIPVAQTWPFDVTMRWPQSVAGRTMDTYHRWMEVVIYATFAGLPAISVPAGFGPDGLPMGLSLIGKPQGDLDLLKLAHAYEMANQAMIAQKPPGVL
ncbi:amidase [Limnohabitans planktonicus]|uniref:Amidase n=1 Tax=Limnohabitans planktonicus II-D5 TaxID=1293045 RepID=A0A2T7UG16_9BURK|nr:amidase [Limnohabitans planktonicus]PVE43636.1 amidase [Limnohabitans planktonicus II-D5]|eukprot:gene28044-34841_t